MEEIKFAFLTHAQKHLDTHTHIHITLQYPTKFIKAV